MGIEGTGIMYNSYDECVEVIYHAIRKASVMKFTVNAVTVKQRLRVALRQDTLTVLSRTDYLTEIRVLAALGNPHGTTYAIIDSLFPNTWAIVKACM